MVVKIFTDSSSDIPPDIDTELDITIVQLYVRFDDDTYRDGLDISADEFYTILANDRIKLMTSTPAPGDYARIYNPYGRNRRNSLDPPLSPIQQCPERRYHSKGLHQRKI